MTGLVATGRPDDMSVGRCKLLTLPKIHNPQGNLTFVEGGVHIPFDIKRVYYLYDVPSGTERGSHAHLQLQQLLIALSGSFDVKLDDGETKQLFHLNRAHIGLYIPPLYWRELSNFTTGAVCLVLASARYDEADYLRDYARFLEAVRERRCASPS